MYLSRTSTARASSSMPPIPGLADVESLVLNVNRSGKLQHKRMAWPQLEIHLSRTSTARASSSTTRG